MITKNGLLEFVQWQSVGKESLASVKIKIGAVNSEPLQIVKSQMRDGREHGEDGAEVFSDVIIPLFARHE